MTRSTFTGLRDSANSFAHQQKSANRPLTSKSVSRLSIKSNVGSSKPLSRVSETRPLSNLSEKIKEQSGNLNSNSRPGSKLSGVSLGISKNQGNNEKMEATDNKVDLKVSNYAAVESISRPQTRSSNPSSQGINKISVNSINPLTLKYPKPFETSPKPPSRPVTSQYSAHSALSQENSDSLKVYINELEDMLRQEKLKRIQSEEMLKKYISRTPINNL